MSAPTRPPSREVPLLPATVHASRRDAERFYELDRIERARATEEAR